MKKILGYLILSGFAFGFILIIGLQGALISIIITGLIVWAICQIC